MNQTRINETGAVDTTLRKPAPDALSDSGPEEVEIKLATGEAMLKALRRHPALQGESQCESLRTTYFDTLDGALAAGKASLRVRRRAKGCEQTLKIALGRKSQMQRSEWNQPLHADAQAPDPAAFPAPAALALDQMRQGAHLVPYAELIVERETRLLRRDKALIEVAFDTGEIRAGERPSQPIAEIELELCEGRLADLLRLALELPLGPDLGWSIRTKAHRAQALAKGRAPQAVSAAPVALTRGMSAGRAVQTIGWNALAHAVGNLGLVITRGDAGAIHQLRVAIRRLRAALSLFGKDLLTGDPRAREWRQELREAAILLAPARDLYVLAQGIKHPPEALLRAQTIATQAAREGLGQPRFQRLWLQLALWLEEGAYLASPLAGAAVEPLAATMIERQRGAIRGMRKRLAGMSDRDLHDLRKDLKKLRYSAGFFQPLDKSRTARAHQDALEQVQEALGRIQDQASAMQAGVAIARLLDMPRGEALTLQSQLDAAMALHAAARAQAIDRARDGLGLEKAHAGWWEAL
ncbi:inorganic triphosphatase YgiF [Novosphingobium sp. SG751A]|uniref:CYTH and CHAD domain-containing protein n=1 Tax=Novosphingobium sp. SG751A TaxID=2587000 RepID=UPI0015517C55|nr:CHAD domain-containing protein [Novosphingobium sp. SG751A]NOW44414.1 inorganic triphosphatase YgiF [Novosphingobium sp. SG751A]